MLIILLEWLAVGTVLWLITGTSVILIRRWAERRHILDAPNERSSHTRPTPRGGGLAIFGVTLAGVLVYSAFNPATDWRALGLYVLGAMLLAGASWLDDLRSLSARIRLVVQAVAAVLVIAAWGYWKEIALPFLGPVHIGWAGLPLTLIWIVGMTNAYNFIDGIDGIAGGQAVVAGLGWFAVGGVSGEPLVSVIGLLLAITCLGFLSQNWPPARIFMGDVGSTFLGYTLAILPLIGPKTDPRLAGTGVLLCWPVLFDTGFTFLRRLLRGENVLVAHRSHLYQRLVVVGYPHLHITVLYIAHAISCALLAFGWVSRLYWSGTASIIFVPILSAMLWVFVIRQERARRRREVASVAPHREGVSVESS